MQCKICKKEYSDDELMNGVCYECFEKAQKEKTELRNYKMAPIEEKHSIHQKNLIAGYFKIWAIFVIIVGIISSGAVLFHFDSIILGIIAFSSFAVASSLLIAIAEIIQLLEDIKNK